MVGIHPQLDKFYCIGVMSWLIKKRQHGVICTLHNWWFAPVVLFFLINIKMSYYWFNKKDLLKKAHDKYHKEGGKERAAQYYERNKGEIKKKQRDRYKNLS